MLTSGHDVVVTQSAHRQLRLPAQRQISQSLQFCPLTYVVKSEGYPQKRKQDFPLALTVPMS